jgi:hypothetical protein
MAEVDVAAKNKEAALEQLQKALKVKPDSIEAQRGIIMLELDAGRSKEALADGARGTETASQGGFGYIFEGDAHAVKKAWGEAAAAYRGGLKQAGGERTGHQAAFGADRRRQWRRGRQVCRDLAEGSCQGRPLPSLSGRECVRRKELCRAAKQYRILLEHNRRTPRCSTIWPG